ncbi:MAG TPA: LapA family protein [Rhodospirillales bacterium]|jgi:uncharacterized membrane protein YciS (DUF1049 family)|nr:LapA family protein [Rhodospirillales bacterium]
MVKLISLIVMVFIAVVVVDFSLSNRAAMVVDLAPLMFTLTAPVFLVVLVSFAVGFVAGGLVAWISGGKKRWRARQRAWQAQAAERKVKRMNAKVASLEAALVEQGDPRPSPNSADTGH